MEDENELREMVEEKNDIDGKIKQLQYDKRQQEQKVMKYLIKHKMFDYFSVNWSRLRMGSRKR